MLSNYRLIRLLQSSAKTKAPSETNCPKGASLIRKWIALTRAYKDEQKSCLFLHSPKLLYTFITFSPFK